MMGLGKVRIRLKRKWHGYAIGTELNPPGMLRSLLLRGGVAEIVNESPAVEAPRKRGRPKKK